MGLTTVSVDQVSKLRMYRGLGADELAEVAAGLRLVHIGDHDALMRQGDPPDGAYFLISGKANVLTKLPGGGETVVAEVGPGSLLGELALIRSAPRTATVRANGSVEALFADRVYFRAALAQLRPSAIKVSRNIAKILAQRLHQLHVQIRDYTEAQNRYFTAVPRTAETNTAGCAPAFDIRSFLPILPSLREFDATELDRLINMVDVVKSSAGTFLNADGRSQGYIVVHGAALSCLVHEDQVHRLNVLGPGSFCAIGPLLDAEPSLVRHFLINSATLLAFQANRFAELVGGLDQFSQRFLSAINQHQAAMLAHLDNHLTRLVGLSRLHNQMKETPSIVI